METIFGRTTTHIKYTQRSSPRRTAQIDECIERAAGEANNSHNVLTKQQHGEQTARGAEEEGDRGGKRGPRG